MAPWEQVYPTIDFKIFQGYSHYFDTKWLNNSPRFGGIPIPHIVEFLKYISEIELGGEDILVKLFILSLSSFLQDWFKSCCEDRGISSFVDLVSRFIEFVKPQCLTYEDALKNLAVALEDEGFTTEIVEDLRDVYHTKYQEPSDIEGEIYEGNCQPLEDEKDFSPDSIECSEDLTREVNHEDEALVTAPPSDEAIQDPIPPAQDEENEVSHFHFQDFNDALFYDLESEKVLEEPLDALNPSCYDKASDIVDNIDEFIRVGRRKWDVIGSNEDPIYDMEEHFQMLPLQLSYEVTNDFDIWQQGNDIITSISRDDLILFSPDDFRSYLECFDEYSLEHLDLFYEEDYQPLFCSDLDRGEDIACPKQGTCDKVLQPPSITLPRYVIKGVVGKHAPCLEFYPGQSLLLEFKGRLNALKRSLLS
jgi:hypothetical protein